MEIPIEHGPILQLDIDHMRICHRDLATRDFAEVSGARERSFELPTINAQTENHKNSTVDLANPRAREVTCLTLTGDIRATHTSGRQGWRHNDKSNYEKKNDSLALTERILDKDDVRLHPLIPKSLGHLQSSIQGN